MMKYHLLLVGIALGFGVSKSVYAQTVLFQQPTDVSEEVPMSQEMLEEIGDPQKIVLANDNAPQQVLLSGDNESLVRFAARIKAEKLGKCRRVDVVCPWHNPHMTEA